MARKEPFLITKPEVRFWLAIIGLVVTGTIAFTTLRMEVRALEDKEVQMRNEVKETDKLLKELNDRTIRMEENQKHIMRALDIEVE
ncbi:MAG: hypothetical protein KAS32_18850 [Candidatus Peribacteraceae bacterium]|nr:hypothetical protein [Candidatus Peribacteraceae bacterium]